MFQQRSSLLTDQNRVGRYVQSTERRKLPTEITVSSKTILHEGEIKTSDKQSWESSSPLDLVVVNFFPYKNWGKISFKLNERTLYSSMRHIKIQSSLVKVNVCVSAESCNTVRVVWQSLSIQKLNLEGKNTKIIMILC